MIKEIIIKMTMVMMMMSVWWWLIMMVTMHWIDVNKDDDVLVITIMNMTMIIILIMMNDLNDPTHFFILTIQSNPSPQTEIQTFSCPTSSIPTIEIHSVIRWFTMFNSYQTIPTLVVFALPSTMPHTIMSVQCRTQCSDIIISTRFKFFDKISQYWRNFIILSKFS